MVVEIGVAEIDRSRLVMGPEGAALAGMGGRAHAAGDLHPGVVGGELPDRDVLLNEERRAVLGVPHGNGRGVVRGAAPTWLALLDLGDGACSWSGRYAAAHCRGDQDGGESESGGDMGEETAYR